MTALLRYALCAMFLASPAVSGAAPAGVERLAWMEGRWVGVVRGIAMEEIWSSPEGGGLVGMHKDSREGRIVSYEFFRIVPDDSGRVCYMTSPLGRTPVPFCAIEVGASRVVFENREHDFPQRILYWREGGRLHARIEGMVSGAMRSEEWVWSRGRLGR